jgi:hypothetical protein
MSSCQGWSQKEATAGRKAQVLVKRHPNCEQIKDETNHNQNHPKAGLSHNSPHPPCADDDLSFFLLLGGCASPIYGCTRFTLSWVTWMLGNE